MKIIARFIFGLDNIIYKTIGWASPIRRAYWRKQSKAITLALRFQHRYIERRNVYRCIPMSGRWYVENFDLVDDVNKFKDADKICKLEKKKLKKLL